MNITNMEHPGQKLLQSTECASMGALFSDIIPSKPELINAYELVVSLVISQRHLRRKINTGKCNRLFTTSAIKQANEAWWDPNNHCVISCIGNAEFKPQCLDFQVRK